MRTIEGFEKYQINERGEIYSFHVNRLIKPQINPKGYKFVRFHKEGKQHHFLLHRLLAFVYLNLPSLDSELEVDHIDGDIKNYRLDNLQVLTYEEHKLKTYGPHWNENRNCSSCQAKLSEYNTSGLCKTCYNDRDINNISIESIEYWVRNHSWVRAAKELGLTDNGLRKRYKKLSGKDPKLIKQ